MRHSKQRSATTPPISTRSDFRRVSPRTDANRARRPRRRGRQSAPWIVNGVPGSIDAGATEIDLTDSTLGVPGALALGRALQVTPDHDSLRDARLDRSTLGTEGGVVLAEALASKACANLQHLHVAGASLGAAGVEAVCGSVPASLASLDLAANDGGDRGAAAAGRALRRCPLLVRLSVAANEIGAEGTRALAPAIRDHSSLETLIASGNRVGDRGGDRALAAIKRTESTVQRSVFGR